MDKIAWETHKQYPQEDYDSLPLCILQLDPADRAVIRIADERDAVQKKTFTKWVNKHLLKACRRIVELYEDLRDGHNLISLLEVLSHDILPRERGHMRFHKIQNVQICLDFLKMKGIRLVNIRSDEIVDGNPKLTLGLIWTIILHFQVSDVVVPGQQDLTARDALLLWSRRTVEGFPGVNIKDFSSSWRDGKAFLAIAHRHRPDLVDVRRAKQSSNKQNLETAFRLYEREFGVTRLLDPEDIDVHSPDERSVITYVSSLYDVFPEVPTVEQSLRDNERQLKTDEYQDLASSLLTWLVSTIGMLEQRDFPATLIELKKRLSDFNRFRLEEIPPRLETKQKLLKLFEEIQGLTSDMSQTGISEELLPENIIRLWNKFVAVQQEKDMAFQAEILRLERLQRLAEKIHREAKYNEDTLRDQEIRIGEEEARVDVIHPFEAKRSCDAIDRSLRNVEENLRGLFRDLHSLQDGKYPQADNLYKRVSDIQSQLSQLRTRLYSNVIQRLLSKTYVEEGKTTIRRTEVVTEVRLVETHPAFKHVQDCLDWIEEKQKHLENAEYDSDVSRVESLIQAHHREHQEVLAFRKEIDRCINDRKTLSSEEQKLYTQTLSKVEVAYSLLSNTSNRRLRCLESLHEFLQASMQELIWLNEKEEAEIRRDWGSSNLNIAEIEDQHKSLVRQLEAQESQFNAVQEKGGAMILDRHPASKIVEAYMATMQSQWSWLLQLTACLENHLRYSTSYVQFFEECHHCDQWIARQTDQLQNRYARDVVSSDEGQHMMRDLQAVQEQIKEYDRRVSSLVLRSTEILPIPQRSQPVRGGSVRVRALCNCQQTEISFQKGEECILLDNSQHAKWKVRTAVGLEAVVPSVCFIIPPPDPDAIEKANRLKLQIEHLQNLWKTQQRRVRLNMVLATIRLVKGWTLKQFMSMDPSQREAIWRALKDDAEKLLTRGSSGDPDLIYLERELQECHQIFRQLSAEAAAEEARQMRTPSQDFLQQLDTINRNLSACDQQLSTLLHKPVPNSRDSLKQATDNYDVFDNSMTSCENSVQELQDSYLSMTPQTSQVESRLNLVVQKFDQLKAISHIYVQRLKNADLVVSGLEEVKQIVSDYEITLASHENMTSELKGLRNLKEELQDLQTSIQQQQPKIDALKRDTVTLRTLVENSRPGLTHHHDVDTIEKDVEDVGVRWDNVCIQVVERLRSVDTAVDHASLYQNGLVGEQDWIDQMQARIETQAPLTGDVDQAKKLLEPSMAIYNSLGERRHQIESVNRHGGQYIREAKIHDKRLRQYRENLENVDSELITSMCKKRKHQDGAECVKVDLDSINSRYMHMVKWASVRLKDITAILSQADVDVQFQMVIDDEIPLLRTFRAELAKRSSMLFDEDMEGFYHQLSEFEGYGNFSGAFLGASDQHTFNQANATATATAEFSTQRSTHMTPMDTSTVKIPSAGEHNLAQLSFALRQVERASASQEFVVEERVKKQADQQTLITVKSNEVSSRGPVLCESAIFNSQTREKLTLVEAIQTGLIDPVSQTYNDPVSKRRIPLSQAVSQGFVSESLYKQLISSSGIKDPRSRRDLTVIEAVGRNLYNPVTNTVKDPLTAESVPLQEALSRGLVSETCRDSLLGQSVSLTSITHSQALFSPSDLSKTEATLSLVQAIDKGLYDKSIGTITDPVTWKQMTILEAVECGRINSVCCEIADPDNGNFISLTEAVKKGVIDPVSGVYIHKGTNRRNPLDEAVQHGLLHHPTPLLDVVVDGGLLEDGKVYDKTSGETVTLIDAINSGQIDGDRKCIMDPRTNEMTSLRDAVKCGLINSKGNYISPITHREKPLLDALQDGDLKLVSEDISFSRSGIRDTSRNQNISVAEALKRGIITKKGTYKDTRTGTEMTIKQAADRGFLDPSLVSVLNQKTGLVDKTGQQISILNAIGQDIVIPEEGVIKDQRTGETLTFQYAASQGIITPDEAKDILELISPVITSTSILTRIHPTHNETVTRSLTISEATSRGLLDDRTQRYTHPESGLSMSVQEAIEKGYLSLSSQWPDTSVFKTFDEVDHSQSTYKFTSKQISEAKHPPAAAPAASVESSFLTKAGGSYSFTMTSVTQPSVTQTVISETRRMTLKSVIDPRTGKEINITEAMKKHLIDLDAGTYRDPVTKSTMPLNIAVEKGYITADLVSEPSPDSGEPIKETRSFSITGVIHPKTGERLTVSRAIHDRILDQDQGVYHGLDKTGRPLPMPISEAIQKGFVIAEDITTTVSLPGSMLRETKTFMLKSVVHPLTGKILSVADAVEQGIIDESEGLYINTVTGTKLSIHEAIEKKLIEAELTSVSSNTEADVNKITTTKFSTLAVTAVVDPRTGRLITVHRAIEEGILDHANGIYYNPVTKESMQLNEAIDSNLVLVDTTKATEETDRSSITSIHITDEQESNECILVEDVHTESMTLSITNVIDPRTMEMVSFEEAVKSGILNINEGIYFNPTTGETMALALAMEKGLIHGEITDRTQEEELMRSSVISDKPAFPLKMITSVIDPRSGKQISVAKAVREGLVNVEKGTFTDTRTGNTIKLEDALKQGFINPSKHSNTAQLEKSMDEEDAFESQVLYKKMLDNEPHWSLVEMELEKTTLEEPEESAVATEVLHYSTEIESHSPLNISTDSVDRKGETYSFPSKEAEPLGLSFLAAAKLGIVDMNSGKVRNPKTGMCMTLEQAIASGLIDESKPAVCDNAGEMVTLRECLHRNLIDPKTCLLDKTKAKNEKINQPQKVDKMNLLDVFESGLLNAQTGKIYDPISGKYFSLQEALAKNIIDGTMVTVKDTQSGERVPLKRALVQGLIDGNRCLVWDKKTNKRIPFGIAVERGLVQNMFDESTGSVLDVHTGKLIPLDKALIEGKLKSTDVTITDSQTGDKMSLETALRKGMVDRSGEVLDSRTGQKMSADEALKMGLLAVVGAPILAGKMVVDSVKRRQGTKSKRPAGIIDSQVNGINGEFQQEEISTPRTTIVFARPGDEIRPTKPGQDTDQFSETIQDGDMVSVVVGQTPIDNISSHVSSTHTSSSSFNTHDMKVERTEVDTKPVSLSHYQDSLSTSGFHHDPVSSAYKVSQESKLLDHSQPQLVEKNLDIDWQSGKVTIISSGEQLTVAEAVQKGVLDSETVDRLAETAIPKLRSSREISINWEDGTITKKSTGLKYTVNQAFDEHFIDRPTAETLVAVLGDGDQSRESSTEPGNVQMATEIRKSVVVESKPDIQTFEFKQTTSTYKTSETTEISSAPSLVHFVKKEMDNLTLGEMIKDNLYEAETGRVIDPRTGLCMSVKEALERNLVNGNESQIRDPASGKVITLNQAVESKVFDPLTGKLSHVGTGEKITLQEAVYEGLIPGSCDFDSSGSPIGLSPPHKQTMSSTVEIEQLPSTVVGMSMEEAKAKGLVNSDSGTFTEPITGDIMSLAAAVSYGYITSGEPEKLTTKTIKVSSTTKDNFQESISPGEMYVKKEKIIDEGNVDKISFAEALDMGYIDLQTKMYTDPNTGSKMPLEDAIRKQVIDTVKPMEPIHVTGLSLDTAQEKGLFDTQGHFKDPLSGEKRTFHQAVSSGSLDGKYSIYDVKSQKVMTIEDGMSEGIIDPRTGQFIEARTNKKFTLNDAAKMGLIALIGAPVAAAMAVKQSLEGVLDDGNTPTIDKTRGISFKTSSARQLSPGTLEVTQIEEIKPKSQHSPESMTVMEALSSGYLNTKTGLFKDPVSGKEITIKQAISDGLIKGKSAAISDPNNGKSISLEQAFAEGILDATGHIMDKSSGRVKNLDNLISSGLVHEVTDTSTPSSSVIVKSNKKINVSSVFDPSTQTEISLQQAIDRNILNLESATYVDPLTRQSVAISEAINKGLVSGSLMDDSGSVQEVSGFAAQVEFSEKKTIKLNSVVDPFSGKKISVANAVDRGIIDKEGKYYSDPLSGEQIPLDIAVERHLVDASEIQSEMTTDERYKKSSESSVTQSRSINIEFVTDPATGKEMHVSEALKEGVLNTDAGVVVNKQTGEKLFIGEAVKQGFLRGRETDVKSSLKSERTPEKSMGKSDFTSIQHGKSFPHGESVSEVSATFVPAPKFVDSKSVFKTNEQDSFPKGQVETSVLQKSFSITGIMDPITGKVIPVAEAIDKGLFDPDKGEVVVKKTGETVPLEEAIEHGFVSADVVEGQAPQDFAIIKGLVITSVSDPRTGQEIPVKEAINKGILDEHNGIYYDPTTSLSLPIEEALKQGLVEGRDATKADQQKQDSKQVNVTGVLDPRTGQEVNLEEAIIKGLVDQHVTMYTDPLTGRTMKIEDAMKERYVSGSIQTISQTQTTITTKRPSLTYDITGALDTQTGKKLSTKEAVKHGLLDPSGTFKDTQSGEIVSLAAAIRRGLVFTEKLEDGSSPRITEQKSYRGIRFKDALQKGHIDTTTGTFYDKLDGISYSVDEAIRTHKLLAEDGSPFQYKGVQKKGITFSFQNALRLGLIDPLTCLFWDQPLDKHISIEDAVSKGCLSPVAGKYGSQIGESVIILKGGAIPSKDNAEMVIDDQTGQSCSIEEAEEKGLVSVVEKDESIPLSDAFDNGLIDKGTGLFHDPRTSDVMTVDQAVLSGNLTVKDYKPKWDEMDQIDSEKGKGPQKEKFSISEAIKCKMIDTDTGIFTDKDTGKSLTVSEAISTGFLEPTVLKEPKQTFMTDNKDQIVIITEGSPFQPKQDIVFKNGEVVSKTATEITVTSGSASFIAKPGFYIDSTGNVVNTSTGNKMSMKEAVMSGIVETEKAEGKESVQLAGEEIPPVLKVTSPASTPSTPSPGEKSPADEKSVSAMQKSDDNQNIKTDVPEAGVFSVSKDVDSGLADSYFEKYNLPHSADHSKQSNENLNCSVKTENSLGKNNTSSNLSDGHVNGVRENVKSIPVVDSSHFRIIQNEVEVLYGYTENLLYCFWDFHVERLIHPRKGTLLGIHEALECCVLPECLKVKQFAGDECITLTEAVMSGQVDRKNGKVVDMNTGYVTSFHEALEQGTVLIDPDMLTEAQNIIHSIQKQIGSGLYTLISKGEARSSIQIMDRKTGRKFSLAEGIGCSLMDPEDATVRDTVSGKCLSWDDAKRVGIILSSKPLTLKQAIVSYLLNSSSGTFLQPGGYGKLLTLKEMIDEGFVDQNVQEVLATADDTWMTVRDAIASDIIDPIQGKVFHQNVDKFLNFHDAVDAGIIGTKISHIHRKSIVGFSNGVAESPKEIKPPHIPVNLIYAIENGLVDPVTSEVSNHGRWMSFSQAYRRNVIEVENCFVVDQSSALVYDFIEAADSGLVDVSRGTVLDTLLGQKFSVFDAKQRGLLKNSKQPLLSLAVALQCGVFDPEEKCIRDPVTKHALSITKGIAEGIIDPSSKLTIPSAGQQITLQQVISSGSLNIDNLDLVFPDGKKFTLVETLGMPRRRSSVLPRFNRKSSLTLDEAITRGIYDPLTNSVRSKDKGFVPLPEALENDLIHTDSLVRDPFSGDILNLGEALEKRIIDPESGKMLDSSGQAIALNFALDKGLILKSKAPLNLSLSETLDEGLFSAENNKFVNPDTNEEIDFATALSLGMIDPSLVKVRDTCTGILLNFESAVSNGLIDLEQGTCLDTEANENFSIIDALDRGIIVDTTNQPSVSLQEAIDEGILDVETCTFRDLASGFSVHLEDAMESGLLDRLSVSVRDIRTNTLLTLDGAVNLGIVDPVTGSYTCLDSDEVLTFKQALDKGMIFSECFEIENTLTEAIKQGKYSENTGMFTEPSTGRVRDLKEVVSEGVFYIETLRVLDKGNKKLLSFKEAVHSKIIDARHALVVDSETSEMFSLKEALDKGLLQESLDNLSLSLKQAVDTGLLNINEGKIIDPLSKQHLSLETAIEIGVINISSVLIRSPDKETFEPLIEALNNGTVTIKDTNIVFEPKGFRADVRTAFDNNTLLDKPVSGLPLADAFQIGLYNNDIQRFWNPVTGDYLTLHEAIIEKLIDADVPQVIVPDVGVFSLREAMDNGLIDPHTGKYIASELPLSLGDAIESGRLILSAKLNISVLSVSGSSTSVSSLSSVTQHDLSVSDGSKKSSQSNLISSSKLLDVDETKRKSDSTCAERNGTSKNAANQSGHNENLTIPKADHIENFQNELLPEVNLPQEVADSGTKKEKQVKPTVGHDIKERISSSDMIHTGSTVKISEQHATTNCQLKEQAKEETENNTWTNQETKCSLKEQVHESDNGMMTRMNISYPLKEQIQEKTDSDMSTSKGKHDPLNEPSLENLDNDVETSMSKQCLFEKQSLEKTDNAKWTSKVSAEDSKSNEQFKELFDSYKITDTLISDDKGYKRSFSSPCTVPDDFSSDLTNVAWSPTTKELSASLDSLIQNAVKSQQWSEKPLPLFEFIQNPVSSEGEPVFQNPQTGSTYTLREAIQNNVLDLSGNVISPISKQPVSLEEAISSGIIDPITGMYQDTASQKWLTLQQAKDVGYIYKEKETNKTPIEIYIEEILSDSSSSGKQKLEEAFSSGLLHRFNSQVIDLDNQPITLRRAASLGMIDVKSGEFKNQQTGECMSVADAVEKGFILHPKGLSLYSSIDQGLYSGKTGKFYDPISKEDKCLKDLITNEVISDICIEIRDMSHDSIISLKEAIKRKIIDHVDGVYVNRSEGKRYNFIDAIAAGLIVSNSTREGLSDTSVMKKQNALYPSSAFSDPRAVPFRPVLPPKPALPSKQISKPDSTDEEQNKSKERSAQVEGMSVPLHNYSEKIMHNLNSVNNKPEQKFREGKLRRSDILESDDTITDPVETWQENQPKKVKGNKVTTSVLQPGSIPDQESTMSGTKDSYSFNNVESHRITSVGPSKGYAISKDSVPKVAKDNTIKNELTVNTSEPVRQSDKNTEQFGSPKYVDELDNISRKKSGMSLSEIKPHSSLPHKIPQTSAKAVDSQPVYPEEISSLSETLLQPSDSEMKPYSHASKIKAQSGEYFKKPPSQIYEENSGKVNSSVLNTEQQINQDSSLKPGIAWSDSLAGNVKENIQMNFDSKKEPVMEYISGAISASMTKAGARPTLPPKPSNLKSVATLSQENVSQDKEKIKSLVNDNNIVKSEYLKSNAGFSESDEVKHETSFTQMTEFIKDKVDYKDKEQSDHIDTNKAKKSVDVFQGSCESSLETNKPKGRSDLKTTGKTEEDSYRTGKSDRLVDRSEAKDLNGGEIKDEHNIARFDEKKPERNTNAVNSEKHNANRNKLSFDDSDKELKNVFATPADDNNKISSAQNRNCISKTELPMAEENALSLQSFLTFGDVKIGANSDPEKSDLQKTPVHKSLEFNDSTTTYSDQQYDKNQKVKSDKLSLESKVSDIRQTTEEVNSADIKLLDDLKENSVPSAPKRKGMVNRTVRFKGVEPCDSSDDQNEKDFPHNENVSPGYKDSLSENHNDSPLTPRPSDLSLNRSLTDSFKMNSKEDSDVSTPEMEATRLTDILLKMNVKAGMTARERRKVLGMMNMV